VLDKTNPAGLDLDAVPTISSETGDIIFSSNQMVRWNNGVLAVWNDPTAPSRSQCVTQLGTQSVETASADVGTQLCVKTRSNKIAYLKITGVDTNTIRFGAVIWRATG
jgi:hypothetical protein